MDPYTPGDFQNGALLPPVAPGTTPHTKKLGKEARFALRQAEELQRKAMVAMARREREAEKRRRRAGCRDKWRREMRACARALLKPGRRIAGKADALLTIAATYADIFRRRVQRQWHIGLAEQKPRPSGKPLSRDFFRRFPGL